jgi:hypothetical protein
MSARKVRVDLNRRGDRNTEPSDQDSGVSCETLEEAERVAHICAAYQQPCELGATCVAYQRVLLASRSFGSCLQRFAGVGPLEGGFGGLVVGLDVREQLPGEVVLAGEDAVLE